MGRVSALSVLLGLLGACTTEESPGPETVRDATTSCDSADDSLAYVISVLDFARIEQGVSVGFDLDYHASEAGDPDGCRKADLVSPDGTAGIDNAFAGLLPALETTEAVAVSGLLQAAIAAGDLLLMMELRGVDDLENDDCVTMSFGPATGTPLLGNDGYLLDGQSFARDPNENQVVVSGLQIRDGAIEMSGISFTLELQVLAAALSIEVQDASVHLSTRDGDRFLDPSAVTSTDTGLPDLGDGRVFPGYFGGSFSIDYMLDVLNANAIDQDLKDFINQALPLSADLKNNAGECRSMSITFEFEATPAFYVEEAP